MARAVGRLSARSLCRFWRPLCWWSSSYLRFARYKFSTSFFAFTGGGPGSATLYIVHFIYNNGFASPFREYGLAAATSLVMAAVLIVLTVIQIRVQGTGLEEEKESKSQGLALTGKSASGLFSDFKRLVLDPDH